MTNYNVQSGTPSSGVKLQTATLDTMVIQSGGIAGNTTVNAGTTLTVNAGGADISTVYVGAKASGIISGTELSATISSGGSVTVANGGIVSSDTVGLNGSMTVQNGGRLVNGVVSGGGKITLQSGATTTGTVIQDDSTANVGALIINTGAAASGTVVSGKWAVEQVYGGTTYNATASGNGAGIDVRNNGIVSGANLIGIGTNLTLSAGSAYGAQVQSGARIDALGNSTLNGNVAIDGGVINVKGTSTASSIRVYSSSTLNLSDSTSALGVVAFGSGAVVNASGNAVISGNALVLDSNGNIQSMVGNNVIEPGATLNVTGNAKLSGITYVLSGATANITNSAGGTIDLFNNGKIPVGGSVTFTGTGSPTTVISGFTGNSASDSDQIILKDVKAANVTSVTYPDDDHVTLKMKDGSSITLNIIGVKNVGYTLATGDQGQLVYEVCFLSDTMISTPQGTVAVQDITIGDDVLVYKNGQEAVQKVVWTGKKRALVNTALADDEAGYPVRILKGAISDGVPAKDMLITAEHCLFFDGRFVPARMLVNGSSIFYDTSITTYDYFHIETEQHSVIMADGMLTESYLDTGNRKTFRQDGKLASIGGAEKTWEKDAAAPLCTERSFVEPLFHSLKIRATDMVGAAGVSLVDVTTDPDLHLLTQNGEILRVARKTGSKYVFMLPKNTTSVTLMSRTARLSETVGPFVDDRRNLGVLVGKIQLFASSTTIDLCEHLSEHNLDGWDALETNLYRWTKGQAQLTIPTIDYGAAGMCVIDIVDGGPYLVVSEKQQRLAVAS